MKFYIAARWDKRGKVKELYKSLEEKGHEITTDWTEHESIKPYDVNADKSRQHSLEDINGVITSDVFIIISSEAGTGMYAELGAAIAQNLSTGKPRIYVVGEHPDRSMFYYHPSAEIRNTVEEVFEELGI
jgi:hypothetical protein